MAAQEEGSDNLGPTGLREFLNQYPILPAHFASAVVRQRAYANAPEPIRGPLPEAKRCSPL